MSAPAVMVAAAGRPIDYGRLIWAIAQRESGGSWNQPGGALQFTTTLWREYSHLRPYMLAQHPAEAAVVARKVLDQYARICQKFGIPVTVEMLALSWRYGVSGAMRRLKSGKPNAYAAAVSNLYYDR